MAVLVYDGDCGFCSRSADVLRHRIRTSDAVTAWQSLDLAALGLTAEQVNAAVQHIADDGTVRSGARAIAATLRGARQPWHAFGVMLDLPGVRMVAAGAYSVVAANRHRLPGSTPTCAS